MLYVIIPGSLFDFILTNCKISYKCLFLFRGDDMWLYYWQYLRQEL